MKNRTVALILSVLLCAACAAACAAVPESTSAGSDKIAVVCTLFPTFDFARQIAKDAADVSVLLPPGVESHSYEPTPKDVTAINRADVFVYTGEYMEPWAVELIKALPDGVTVIDASVGLDLDADEHGGEDEHAHHGGMDPHIWTDPTMAAVMAENIAAALEAADPENALSYRENAARYCAELAELDAEIEAVVAASAGKTICFGGRNAMHYFLKRYGIEWIGAYHDCSEETEPSARAVAEIIKLVQDDGISVIYHEELSEPTVARAIAEETGAKLLLLHSCHNVTMDELSAGATYISLMEQNLENLRVGLG